MKKEDYIRKYGKAAYEKQQQRDDWTAKHFKKIAVNSQERSRKGGKYYEQQRQYQMNGIPHEKLKIRSKHRGQYRPYKRIIAPDSELHHEWIPGTGDYRGVALVEKDQHIHGYVDAIQILEGEITLFTESEISQQGGHD